MEYVDYTKLKFRLPTIEEAKKMDVITHECTHFSAKLGACDYSKFYCQNTGSWWTSTVRKKKEDGKTYDVSTIITPRGNFNEQYLGGYNSSHNGILPVIELNDFLKAFEGRTFEHLEKIVFGEYMQSEVIIATKKDIKLERQLENVSEVFKTGKKYSAMFNGFSPIEFIHKGKKYAKARTGDSVRFFYIEPITWIVDLKCNLVYPEKILSAGIDFDTIPRFLNVDFSKDIIPCGTNLLVRETLGDANRKRGFLESFGKTKINRDLAEENEQRLEDIGVLLIRMPKSVDIQKYKDTYNWLKDFYSRYYYKINSNNKKISRQREIFDREICLLEITLQNYIYAPMLEDKSEEVKGVQKKI